jgi:hypothetical protein
MRSGISGSILFLQILQKKSLSNIIDDNSFDFTPNFSLILLISTVLKLNNLLLNFSFILDTFNIFFIKNTSAFSAPRTTVFHDVYK